MALNYANFFANSGELIEGVNTFKTIYTTIDSMIAEIEASFQGSNLDDKLGVLYTYRDTWRANNLSAIRSLVSLHDVIITDRITIREELTTLGDASDVATVLQAFIEQMFIDVESVLLSVVTVGAVTRTVVNATAGVCMLDKVLDGYSAPIYGGTAHIRYNGVASELAIPTDDMIIKCTSDSETGSVAEGAEVWQWNGNPKPSDVFSSQNNGNGTGPTVITLNSYTYITNREFENFTANVPDNWIIVLGTAGTHILKDTATMYQGLAGLKIKGDGALATINLKHTLTSYPKPRQRCMLAVYVKGDATIAAGTLVIKFTGTGYAAGGTEQISMNAAALAAQAAFGLKTFYINLPAEIPDDFAIDISVTGTLTNNSLVLIDRMAFGPVAWNNGINAVVIAGAAKFIQGDKHLFTITNDDAGAFQKFFRDAYKVQLASNAVPTRANALTTD